ncbi:response regulator receiver modulated metal dependent phosphohydrolase [Fusibacter sp. 3D3]|nr:response regulator receiver modulated metal dependent phosphohydrolase [Fusibacter sp. 3D3]
MFVLLGANIAFFSVFCDVSHVIEDKESVPLDVRNTPIKVILDELELLSDILIKHQESNLIQDEHENKLFLEALVSSDSNILSVHYTVEDEDLKINSSKSDEISISEPKQDPTLDVEYVTFSKNVINSKGEWRGNLIMNYQYEAFKASVLATMNESDRVQLLYSDDSRYIIVDQSNHFKYLPEIFRNRFTQIILMILLLLVSCYVFVSKSYETLNQLVVALDTNYRKNIGGSYLIEEYHVIRASLDEIKEDIDQKMLKISELKVVENELIQDIRYKTKQFEALYKNHVVLKNKALYLTSFFDAVANNIDQMIWLMDASGHIIYVNQALEKNLKMENMTTPCDRMSAFIEGFDEDLGLLLERDYKSIKFTFKNHIFNESLNGSSVRIKTFHQVNCILCFCSKNNFENKMNQNYLKKSRDLHFINEIGKIVSVNNNIDVTLQDILDKVAFLANLNSSTIRLVNEDQKLELKTISGYSTAYVLSEEIPIEGRHMGYCFKENKIILINHEEDLRFHEPILEQLLKEGRSIAYIPLANYQKSFGVMSIISDFKFKTDDIILLESISINVTISLEKVLLYDQLKANYFKTVEAFVTAAEIKQERFSGHSRRVAKICSLIAQRLYLKDSEIDDIYIAGLLHDIGKLGFADNSLEYFFDIDEHGAMGRKMIEHVGFNREILNGIEFHHLNYDLSNKPIELQEQPYYAQIIRLANDFDLFMNYNSGESDRNHFVTKMTAESGTVYSPQLLKILEDLIDNRNDALDALYDSKIPGEHYEN